jgi:uncharacterized Tic20 family protein
LEATKEVVTMTETTGPTSGQTTTPGPMTAGTANTGTTHVPPYGNPTPALAPAPAPTSLSTADERTWGMVAHLSGFVAAYVALGFLGPLTVMLTVGNRSAFVRRHAVEALNFNLSVLLYAAVSAVLVVVLIGIPMLIAVGIAYLVATIGGALAANRGEEYRYPMNIRFVS